MHSPQLAQTPAQSHTHHEEQRDLPGQGSQDGLDYATASRRTVFVCVWI
jgi:hypothetical protein